MSVKDANILVVGGGSRIAEALVPLLGDVAAYAVRRPIGRPRELVVADYGAIPSAALTGMGCVINCAGVSTGDPAHLAAVNADLPHRLAIAAKAAGVRQLVHVSSFSVYGGAHAISCDTPEAPASDYGRSKQAGDAALLALADASFAVTILRLPLVYAPASLGKLGQLLALWTRVRVLPVPAGDIARAMIGVELSATVIARIAGEPLTGAPGRIVFAADPEPFTYAAAADARRGRLYRLPVPRAWTRLAERIFPAVASRLFADSRLAEADNLAIRYGLSARLRRDIAAADLH